MSLYCGVDGGGTRTRALLADSEGRFVGYGASGASNPKAVGLEGAAFSVCEALSRAFRDVEDKSDAHLFIGMAGVRTEADRKAVSEAMTQHLAEAGLGGANVRYSNDLDVAHAAALGGEPGVVLVVGTGSAALARDEQGRIHQAGGWGWFIDDPGSGYWLGYQAMRAAARSYDGRGPATLLEDRVRSFLRIQTLNEMPNIIYNPHFSRERVAELAPIIFEMADAGDACANTILREGFAELALMTATAARKLGMERPLVAPVGGITQRGAAFDKLFSSALAAQMPTARVAKPRTIPVIGGVIRALMGDGLRLSDAAMAALQEEATKAAAIPPKIDAV